MTTSTHVRSCLKTVLLIAAACNPASKVNSDDATKLTTAYVTSTRQLKSDKIPDTVFHMTTLRRLTVNGDDCKGKDMANCWLIREIPAEIADLQQLLLLELKGNDIRTVPQELGHLLKLKTLDLSDNPKLTNINAVTKLVSLEYLYLYGCDLQVLPDDISGLTRLKQLGLAGNRIGVAEQERLKQALPNCRITF
jgi:hypothetical protein